MVDSGAPSRTVVSSRLPVPSGPLLARDHLVARLRQLPAAGGENPTGAPRLHERAGMSVRTATEVWVTPLHLE